MTQFEVIARSTPTVVRYGSDPDAQIRLDPDTGAVFDAGRIETRLANVPGPGEGGPPDITMLRPDDLIAASPKTMLARAKRDRIHIRVRDVRSIDLRKLAALARDADEQGHKVIKLELE